MPSSLTCLANKIAALLQQQLWTLLPICFLSGSLASLSMAPLNAWPVLFISISVLYMAITHANSGKTAFAYGWLFGFGYFLFSLSWIGNALLVEGNPYKWAWPLAVSGLPALLAFFPGFAALLSKKYIHLRSLWGWLGFVSFYCGFEWLRGHLFTGFPWNLPGYTWAGNLTILQVLWVSDVYMLSWLTLLWASAPACLFLLNGKERILCAALTALTFTACLTFGVWQLQNAQLYHNDLNIKLIQPNIEQSEKWHGDKMAGHFRKHLDLSENIENSNKPTLIIWPETALSYRIFNAPGALEDIRSMLASYHPSSTLLTGMLRFDPEHRSYANSLVMIEHDGTPSNIYDKHHLVPFGEYIPFQKWIPLTPVVQFKGFESGTGLQTMETPQGLKYSPLICYEIIFPGRAVKAHSHPDFIVNVTNDAWYGKSAGPYQHLTQALFRAVETGIPVIRAANTGFSGVITPAGHIEGKTQLFTSSSQTLELPYKKDMPTGLQKFKHLLSITFIIFFIFTGILSKQKLTTRKSSFFYKRHT